MIRVDIRGSKDRSMVVSGSMLTHFNGLGHSRMNRPFREAVETRRVAAIRRCVGESSYCPSSHASAKLLEAQ